MELKDVIHYYLGCDVIYDNYKYSLRAINKHSIASGANDGCFVFADADDCHWVNLDEIKPIFRRLEDMTEDDKKEVGFYTYQILRLELNHKGVPTGEIDYQWSAKQMHYLISRGYWLFGEWAWEKGLIIDRKTIGGNG